MLLLCPQRVVVAHTSYGNVHDRKSPRRLKERQIKTHCPSGWSLFLFLGSFQDRLLVSNNPTLAPHVVGSEALLRRKVILEGHIPSVVNYPYHLLAYR